MSLRLVRHMSGAKSNYVSGCHSQYGIISRLPLAVTINVVHAQTMVLIVRDTDYVSIVVNRYETHFN